MRLKASSICTGNLESWGTGRSLTVSKLIAFEKAGVDEEERKKRESRNSQRFSCEAPDHSAGYQEKIWPNPRDSPLPHP